MLDDSSPKPEDLRLSFPKMPDKIKETVCEGRMYGT